MAYSTEDKERIFKSIISEIENGASLRSAITKTNLINRDTFNEWIKENETFSDQYARAKDERTDFIFEEILTIADSQEGDIIKKDGIEVTNHDVIQRARLRVDARKWMLGKMNKRKYGDSLDMTTDGEAIQNNSIPLVLSDGRSFNDLKNELKPE